METIQIAKVCHEVNKAYCEALDDTSQVNWDDAPDWQRESAIDGVKFHIANPDAGPESSHENWLKQKKEKGWIWGPVKDVEKKQHPCYVNYEALPKEQKAKDYIFRQIVHSLT